MIRRISGLLRRGGRAFVSSAKAKVVVGVVVAVMSLGVAVNAFLSRHVELHTSLERANNNIMLLRSSNDSLMSSIKELEEEKIQIEEMYRERGERLEAISSEERVRERIIREVVYEKASEDMCVISPVPDDIFNSLFEYARSRNESRN